VIILVYNNKQKNPMYIPFLINSRMLRIWRLLFFSLLIGLPGKLAAHPSPNTLIFLDISPKKVMMEVQMPIPELELAFKPGISQEPEKLLERWELQLREYLLAHIHAYCERSRPWGITIENLSLSHGKYPDSNISYWEVIASVNLMPQTGDNTHNFYLDYDVIMHQVMNHAALVSVRSDWENGGTNQNNGEVQAIAWDLQNNIIPPMHVNLQNGNWWTGFVSMIKLGMHHIAEGTDHLMFLLVLLLPATLQVNKGKWEGFGGTRNSIYRLLKIVTAFTVGHSITLLLGAIGWVKLPSQPIEILISFSILVSAVHALRPLFPGKEMFISAGFGLVHGLAFAATLSNLHLDARSTALSILGFNLGIELMQLFVVALTVPWLIILSKKTIYKPVRITGAVLATLAAIVWIIQRI